MSARRGPRVTASPDDTDAIQQVLNRLSDKRPKGELRQHVVYFPPGKYRITRTLTVTESTGGWLVGHGRSTELVWEGEEGGRMYWSNGCRYVCYEGTHLGWTRQGRHPRRAPIPLLL